MHRRRLFWTLVLTGILSLPAQVFWRRPATFGRGWRSAREAPVRVQEGRGDARMYAVEGRLQQIEADLRNRHGEALAWRAGENVAWALALDNNRLHRYLVQPLPEGDGFWVLHLEQSARQAGKPGQRPTSHQLREVPHFPQSEPRFFTRDEENLFALEVSSTPAAPAAVLEQMDGALRGDGWLPSPLNTSGMRMYIRRDQVAVLGAVRGKDGMTRVTRLHKPLGVK